MEQLIWRRALTFGASRRDASQDPVPIPYVLTWQYIGSPSRTEKPVMEQSLAHFADDRCPPTSLSAGVPTPRTSGDLLSALSPWRRSPVPSVAKQLRQLNCSKREPPQPRVPLEREQLPLLPTEDWSGEDGTKCSGNGTDPAGRG